jgi:hypothetical protein
MRDLLLALLHLAVMAAKLYGPSALSSSLRDVNAMFRRLDVLRLPRPPNAASWHFGLAPI